MAAPGRRSVLALLGARSLEVTLEGAEPAREIRLFKCGENETSKGVFLFDAEAAALVMAEAEAHGVEKMIDLEHLSLADDSVNFDPDARAWFNLELRHGELWAVNIRWTEDGARRLREKTQRYISPAFATDKSDPPRITRIANIALTAMPATYDTPALVAATRRHKTMTVQERIALLSARFSIARGRFVKLAEDAPEGEAPAGKGAQVKSCAEEAEAALADLVKVVGGGADMDTVFAAMQSAQDAIDALEKAMAAFGVQDSPGETAAPPVDAAASLADPKKDEEQKMSARDRAELITLRAAREKADEDAKVMKLAAEMQERAALETRLVKLGRETPHTVKMLAGLPMSDLRSRVEAFEKLGGALGNVRPPAGHGDEYTLSGGTTASMSEGEAVYVKARYAAIQAKLPEGVKLRALGESMVRYEQAKARQLAGAEAKGDGAHAKALAAPLSGDVVTLASRAGLVTLASTPVRPIEEFGGSSQIALQSFRLEYNIVLASQPVPWAESIGQMLADGSMKTTYPISYDTTEYQEDTGPSAAANAPLSFDLEVVQRHFKVAKQVELRRLIKGDFAYVQRWSQMAAEMARARVFLRNVLVTALLEAGASTLWGVTSLQTGGIDGANFFSATHKNNPADPTRKLRTSATFSNYQASATPFSIANLTAEKRAVMQVAAPDGRELGGAFDGILYPSILEQDVYNAIKVQDLILEAKTSLNGVANAQGGGVRNPHFNSGLEMTRGPDLAGTSAATADYYLYNREGISQGKVPWIIAEDPTEELRLWDESSDHYKNTNHIKIESHAYLNAVLAFPHCIRLIKGA